MLNSRDIFNIRRDMQVARGDYRETTLVYPDLTSGSNYDPYTDGPFDISSGSPGYFGAVTFTTYRCHARVKIIQPTSLMGMGPIITGVEVGDYLLMFRKEDKGQVDRVIDEKRAYIYVDGTRLRPETTVLTGLTQSDEFMSHCKRYEPEFKATGL